MSVIAVLPDPHSSIGLGQSRRSLMDAGQGDVWMDGLGDDWTRLADLRGLIDPDDHLLHWVLASGVSLCDRTVHWERPGPLDASTLDNLGICDGCARALGELLAGRELEPDV